DTTLVSNATEEVWAIQRERAAQLGVSVAQVAQVVETALAGVPVTYIAEPGQLQPTPVILRLPPSWQGQLSQLQSLTVTSQTTGAVIPIVELLERDRKSTRLNSSHVKISYAVFCLKKKKNKQKNVKVIQIYTERTIDR